MEVAGGVDAVSVGGATEGAAFAVSVLADGVLAGGLGCVDAIGESVGLLLVVVLLEVATGSLLIGAAGAGVELLMVGSGVLLAFTLAVVFDEAVATLASGLDELFVLRLGAGVGTGAGVASATLAGSSRAGVAAVDEASVAAGVPGAASAPALLAVWAAGVGTLISLSLTLWSNSSAPPITVAVMTPNAIPKWFMEFLPSSM